MQQLLAHEIGQLALGHVGADVIIVDLEGPEATVARADDDEEIQADRFALELLAGHPEPAVVVTGEQPNATRLATAAFERSAGLQIEPGMLAQVYDYSTGAWQIATGTLKVIYEEERPIRQEVNTVARRELRLDPLELTPSSQR